MLHSFSEAMKSLDDVKLFLESRGCIQESVTVGSTMDHIAIAHLLCTRQTTHFDFILVGGGAVQDSVCSYYRISVLDCDMYF